MQVWRLPAELTESRVGAPLTPDDLLDFHLLLAERRAGSSSSPPRSAGSLNRPAR